MDAHFEKTSWGLCHLFRNNSGPSVRDRTWDPRPFGHESSIKRSLTDEQRGHFHWRSKRTSPTSWHTDLPGGYQLPPGFRGVLRPIRSCIVVQARRRWVTTRVTLHYTNWDPKSKAQIQESQFVVLFFKGPDLFLYWASQHISTIRVRSVW